tara:strand:- start:1594 stop:3465 length:1872 start_codon:yes stop_codon:yes gene_type:complete
MCGIFGLFNPKQKYFSEDILKNSLNSISHRGPDHTGTYVNKYIQFGMNRLSIIDIENGNQPLFDSNKNYSLIFNGEIYNFKYLKEKYLFKYHFKTNSDTEVLLAGLISYGHKFLKFCNGIYSFALFDIKNSSLIIGRDPLGIKPLYYTFADDIFFFSSELKPFFRNDKSFKPIISKDSVSNYLSSFYVFSPNSSIEKVKSVDPGSIITISKNLNLKKKSFYSKNLIKFKYKKKFELQKEIVDAVDRQLIADVPVGLLLSSGLDSMSILASIKKLGKLDQIETYTSFYDNKNFSEEKNVLKISKEWGLNSHFINISTNDVYHNLDDYFKCFDDLEFMPNSFAMYYLCKNIKKNHKVLLTGIGGDEIFLSYKTHIANYIKNFFPKSNRIPKYINYLSNYLPNSNTYLSLKEKLLRFSIGSMYDIEYSYFIWRYIFSPLELEKNFNKNLVNTNIDKIFENQKQYYDFFMNKNYTLKKSMSYIDINTWLIDHGLKLWDKAGMYNSIEIRVPLLDLDFLNGLFQQPDKLRNLRYGHKTALKNSFSDILPNYILNFPKKGFSIPVFDWLSDKRINTKFKELTYSFKNILISEKYLRYMWQELDRGNNNFAFKLWNLGCLQGWKTANNLK